VLRASIVEPTRSAARAFPPIKASTDAVAAAAPKVQTILLSLRMKVVMALRSLFERIKYLSAKTNAEQCIHPEFTERTPGSSDGRE
jgi:hypothetical protein